MSKKTKKAEKKVEVTSTIFEGPALTMQQREALKKQEKEAEKAEVRELRRRMWEERKAKKPADKKEMQQTLVLVLALVLLVALGAIFLMISNSGIGREQKIGATYYINEAETATKSDEGVTAEITQAYYTKNGGLYVHLSLANGLETAQHLSRIHLKLTNGNDEVITDVATTGIDPDFYVIQDGYGSYDLFIPKRYLQIKDDPLTTISYTITIDSVEKE